MGQLHAATYLASTFRPEVTFTLPQDGWSNLKDTVGDFKLVPPGSAPAWTGKPTDYIGVYASVTPAAPCARAASGVRDAAVVAAYLKRQPAVSTTTVKFVSTGGLNGVVLDVRLAKTWKQSCFATGPQTAFVVAGLPPTEYDEGICCGAAERLYLLNDGAAVLGILVYDRSGGSHLDGYDVIVRSLQFGSP